MRHLAEALWILVKTGLIAGTIALGSCATAGVILDVAPDRLPDTYMAEAPSNLDRETAKTLLQSEIYGPVISPSDVSVLHHRIIDPKALNGSATLEEWRVEAGYGGASRPLDVVLVRPNNVPDAPVIISQNFCPNHAVIPLEGVTAPGESGFCEGGGLLGHVFGFFFGRYIVTPPLQDIIDRGYAIAAIYPSQFIPDSGRDGDDVLDSLFERTDRPGALSAWAGLSDLVADLIEDRHGDRPFIAYGHSRFGKTALLSAAWFDSIDAAIAHQSGTLGASRLADGTGEPLSALVGSYPHWGNRKLRRYADTPARLPVEAKDLLAAISPKPVLLGNARRDTWSDPFGAFVAAQAAWGDAFGATEPGDFRPEDRYAFWQRPGTHGVVKEDWPAFLDWLDANMK